MSIDGIELIYCIVSLKFATVTYILKHLYPQELHKLLISTTND